MNITTKRPRALLAGAYFEINRAVHAQLIARNATAGELATLLVLGAASDASNETSRAGIQAIRKTLGVGPATAQSFLGGLIANGEISALALANPRDMTAARFQLAQPTQETDAEAADDPDATFVISNDLVRGAIGQRFLRKVVVQNDRPLLDLLLDLHADPLGLGSAPRVMRCLPANEVGRLGSLILATSALAEIDTAGPLFEDVGLRGDARRIVELVDYGLVEWGVHLASQAGPTYSLCDPIATLRRGIIRRDTADSAIAALAGLLIATVTKTSVSLSEDLPIVRSANENGLHLVAIPKLTVVPRTVQIREADADRRLACRARIDDLQGILRAAFPELEARIAEIEMAAGQGA
ncbi:hypothetical protein C8J30_11278 [Rhodobacter viridis]|uniref:Uncharacterized protein n=1 Tax=Rhodobacter viridis TaxID=1054202 RepID=A0A318U9D5_9RHOB|nr:hypothetical protein [Rhodobacter viridis]PYF08659.1 hypothetical protein C8J30_11278 [Rhodobacter viridis]